jgi:hypothetical protein
VKLDATGKTEPARRNVSRHVRRGRCTGERLSGMAETGVVLLIAQRSQVQILPPLPVVAGERPDRQDGGWTS